MPEPLIFGCRSMDTDRCPFSDTFRRASRPATRRPPFEKGVDPKTFSVGGQHTFYGKGKNSECRNNGFPGTDLWIPCAVPSVGVLCSRAWWEASSKTQGLSEDASRLHDLKRPSLFRRDEVPARNAHRLSGFALTHRKKFLRVPRGVFSKTLPWQGVGRHPTKGEGEPAIGVRLFRRDEVLSRNTHKIVRLCLYKPKKVFEGSKGRFFKNAPWQGVGRSPTGKGAREIKVKNGSKTQKYERLSMM